MENKFPYFNKYNKKYKNKKIKIYRIFSKCSDQNDTKFTFTSLLIDLCIFTLHCRTDQIKNYKRSYPLKGFPPANI